MYDISYLHLDNQFLNDDSRNDPRCVIIIETLGVFVTFTL